MGEGAARRNRRYRLVETIRWGRVGQIIRLAARSAHNIPELKHRTDCGNVIAPHEGEFEPDRLCHPRDCDALRVRMAPTSNVRFGSKAATSDHMRPRRRPHRSDTLPAQLPVDAELRLEAHGSAGRRRRHLRSQFVGQSRANRRQPRGGFGPVQTQTGGAAYPPLRHPSPRHIYLRRRDGRACRTGRSKAGAALGH